MEKINTSTPDLTQENIAKLAEIFPDVVTESVDSEGKLSLSVDFDALQEDLSVDACLSSYPKERYQFTWPGKREAKLEARRPINKTLKPCPEKSVNWDTTENIYIEGDNLEALKIMRETYMHKVKMIYIDPPYNTGHDFVYKDNFAQSKEEYLNEDGSYDEEGNRLEENLESNGRFHSDWCSMMYSRLLLARDFLTDDGVIFISIDDNEVRNLKNICDEVFGETNFIAQLIWERAYSPKNDAKYVSNSHDYILMYARAKEEFEIGRLPRTKEANSRYKNPDNDPRGPWKPSDMSVKTYNASADYPIKTPAGRTINPPKGRCWRFSEKSFLESLEDNRIYFGANGDSVPQIKRFLSELKFDGMAPTSILFYKDVGHSQEGSKEVTSLLNAGVFDGPKPVRLLKHLMTLANLRDDSIVLDFFSGSATTGHALFEKNLEDDTHRKFILVQIPEVFEEKSKGAKAGYRNICEVGEKRIFTSGENIQDKIIGHDSQLKLIEDPERSQDTGFRVFEVAESNIKDMTLAPEEIHQMNFEELNADNLKEGATNLDLLYEVLPKFRIKYSADVETKMLCDKEVFVVNGNQLVACFDTDITNDVIQAIAEIHPLYAVFRDTSFADEAARTNLEEIFKAYSPDTQLRVI